MIDEKKLIEELNKYARENFHLTDEFEWVLEGMIKALDIVERQPKVGEWIPCSKELPIGRKLLLQTEGNKMTVAFLDKKMNWYSDSGDGWCTDIDVKPIAWMPLPAPYKEDMRGGKND